MYLVANSTWHKLNVSNIILNSLEPALELSSFHHPQFQLSVSAKHTNNRKSTEDVTPMASHVATTELCRLASQNSNFNDSYR